MAAPPKLPPGQKVSKASVDYSKGMGDTRCRDCAHFNRTSQTCQFVEGHIDPAWWCRLWRRR